MSVILWIYKNMDTSRRRWKEPQIWK